MHPETVPALLAHRRRMLSAAIVFITLLLPVAGAAQTGSGTPRPEHPRPDFARADWQSLNGRWEFEFDDQDQGLRARWFEGSTPFSKTIVVPYTFQSRMSGIGDTGFHDVMWYRRALDVPAGWTGRRVLLNFGAVDYEAQVWVNGRAAGTHRGGHVGFALDVTDLLKPSGNVVVVRVVDPGSDRTIPRGKQYWRVKSESIFYTRTSGLWQPVWIEAAGTTRIARLRVTPDIERSEARVAVDVAQAGGTTMPTARLAVVVGRDGKEQARVTTALQGTHAEAVVALPEQRLWSPEHPNLYDLSLEIEADGKAVDHVDSYFGQRTVGTYGGKFLLNGEPYFLRLALDQGYWPESILTPPSDEAIKYDIRMAKSFGLNGVRKHQKAEDPRWLYWADTMGFVVWGEMANAYDYSPEYVSRFTAEWQEIVARDYNHPSIVAWVPINESWGVPKILTNAEQQAHAKTMYQLVKSLDPMRPVVDNDGWEHTEQTDLMTLHDYARTGAELTEKYAHLATDPSRIPRNGRDALVRNAKYNGSPFLMTEFGGVAFRIGQKQAENEWGYSGVEPTREAFLGRLGGLVKALTDNPVWAGYCYTQLTDVEQEINGLMTYDRKPKVSSEEYKQIFAR